MLSLLNLIVDPATGRGVLPLESRAAVGAEADFDSLFAAAAELLGRGPSSAGESAAGTGVPALPLGRQGVAGDPPADDGSASDVIPAVDGVPPIVSGVSAAVLPAIDPALQASAAETSVTQPEHAAGFPAARAMREVHAAPASPASIRLAASADRPADDGALARAAAAMTGGGSRADSVGPGVRIAAGDGATSTTAGAGHTAVLAAGTSARAVTAATPPIAASLDSAPAGAGDETATNRPAPGAGDDTAPPSPLEQASIQQRLAAGPQRGARYGAEGHGAASAGAEASAHEAAPVGPHALGPRKGEQSGAGSVNGAGLAHIPNTAALPSTGSRGTVGSGPDADAVRRHATSRSRDGVAPALVGRGEPGALPEPARVRQAADVMRQWSRRAASTDAAMDDIATRTTPPHGPAPHAPAPAPAPAQLATVAAAADAGTLTLADGQAAAEQLVQRVLQGQARHSSSVRFQLSPAELGDLHVHMRRHGDRLDIAFTASHGGARDLIESCLPNLRSLLHDVGIQLADVDVRHEARDHAAGGGQPGTRDEGGNPRRDSDDARTSAVRGEDALSGHAAAGMPAGDARHRPGSIDAFA